MTEWETITSDNLPERPLKSPTRLHPTRRWLLLAGAVVGLLIGGFIIVRGRLAERQAVLQEDLTAFIFEEETRRALGDPDQGTDLIIPEAPPAWQRAYGQGFAQGQDPPGSIQLQAVDFDGRCAVVEVELAGQAQVRAYCLSKQGWRRAPLPEAAWGTDLQTLRLTNGVQLHFRPRDRAFAETLAGDLPLLFQKADPWGLTPAGGNPYQALEIVIEPHELHGPLVSQEPQRIVLNSPQLTPTPWEGELSGEAAVRLALAEAFLRRAGPDLAESPPTLPGAARFLAAVQTVMAMQLVLPAETQTALLERWRDQLAGRWISPFFAELLPPARRASSQQAEAAARLTAAYIAQLRGPDRLAVLLWQLPGANSWDRLFQPMFDRSTLMLEAEAAAYAGARRDEVITHRPGDHTRPVRQLLIATLERFEPLANGHRATVRLPDQAESLLVDMPAEALQTPDGTPLLPGCIPAGTRLAMAGEWLELGRRWQATRLNILETPPPAIEPAPPGSLAYLITGEPPAPKALVALTPQGALQPLTFLSPTLQVFPLPVAAGEPLHFLIRFDLPGCNRSWFARYEPTQGVAGQWLSPAYPMHWLWRADRQDLLLFRPQEDSLAYDIYATHSTLFPGWVGQADNQLFFMGWSVETGRLVATVLKFDETYLVLLDLAKKEQISINRPAYRSLRARRLSPDGNWLAYLVRIENLFSPSGRLDVLDLTRQSDTTLIQLEPDEGLGTPIWSLYLDQVNLAVVSGPIVYDILRPNRLLIVRPDQPGQYQVVAQAGPDEQVAMPVFCADGALLYRVERDDQYDLRRQAPGHPAQTLLTLAEPFQPVACP